MVWYRTLIVLCCYTEKSNLLHIQFISKIGQISEKTTVFLFFSLTIFGKQVYYDSITESSDFQILMIEVSVQNEQSA
jgi:hypothetical protein